MAKSLVELAKEFGADKRERALLAYEREFYWVRDQSIVLLEIGVKGGGSLRMWHSYFPRARIIGIDVRPIKPIPGIGDRTTIECGDQSDLSFLEGVVARYGPFDIIVEDGSHVPAHQQSNFEFLFPHVNADGIYVMEDIHTSYRPKYRREGDRSSVDYIRDLVDYVNINKHEIEHKSRFLKKYGRRIEKIIFVSRSAIIQKRGGPPTSAPDISGKGV